MKRIGIVAVDLADPFVGSVVEEVAKSLRAHGYAAAIVAPPPVDDEAWFRGWLPNALVVVGEFGAAAKRQLLPEVPRLMAVDGGNGELGFRLELGLIRGLELACRYLTEEGHRHIALLGSSASVNAAALSRRIDEPALSLQDIPADTPGGAGVSLRQALEAPDAPSALVCLSDALALAALRYGAITGIRIPAALSVIGFGDSTVARHSYPALSSIRVDVGAIGAYCAGAMSELLFGREPAPFTPRVRLVIRESSGARSVSREA